MRTEFLFLDRDAAPDVDEQVAAYRGLAEALGGRRITLRTLDVGGDKPLPYAPQPPEANPFLGVRGIRFALAQRELLRAQLLAIATVAHETPVSVMFPMVSTLDELFEVRRRLDEAVAAIGRGVPAGLQVGIMVEVPATALRAATFAPHVDFLSIGTNDLTQYALAAERGNPQLAALADPFDPGVLALVESVCRARRGRPAGGGVRRAGRRRAGGPAAGRDGRARAERRTARRAGGEGRGPPDRRRRRPGSGQARPRRPRPRPPSAPCWPERPPTPRPPRDRCDGAAGIRLARHRFPAPHNGPTRACRILHPAPRTRLGHHHGRAVGSTVRSGRVTAGARSSGGGRARAARLVG